MLTGTQEAGLVHKALLQAHSGALRMLTRPVVLRMARPPASALWGVKVLTGTREAGCRSGVSHLLAERRKLTGKQEADSRPGVSNPPESPRRGAQNADRHVGGR